MTLKLRKTRRSLAMSAVALSLAAGASLATAGTAQATVGGGGCRINGWAGTTPGALLYPCSIAGGDYKVGGYIQVQNVNRLAMDSCAQLLRVNGDGSTTQVYDFGCNGWTAATGFGWYTNWVSPGYGTYVVQTGYWYAGQYWGGAQSQRIAIY